MWKDKYENVGEKKEGRYRVKLNGKWGHVDKNGKVTTPIIYGYTNDFYNGQSSIQIIIGLEIYNNFFVDKDGKLKGKTKKVIRGVFENEV